MPRDVPVLVHTGGGAPGRHDFGAVPVAGDAPRRLLRAYYRLQWWWWVRVFTTINEFVH